MEWFSSVLLTVSLITLGAVNSVHAENPHLDTPKLVGQSQVRIGVTNCTDPRSLYVIQISTNLHDWVNYQTNSSNLAQVGVPATNAASYYRVMVLQKQPSIAFVCKSNFSCEGDNIKLDSFDSSDTNYSSTIGSFPGQYDATKSKSGADLAVGSSIVNIVSGTINGHLHTPTNTVRSQLQMGPSAAVGDIAWTASHFGIQNDGTPESWWQPDFDLSFPDVAAPFFVGSPVPAHGVLNGGSYITSSKDAPANLSVTGPTVLWVQGSATFKSITLATTNNASLVMYVGTASGSGDSFKLSGSGNSPGYAKDLKIYGLPSLSSISTSGNTSWAACIYAPTASATFGGGSELIAGPVIVKSMALTGHVRIHFDESLGVNVAAR